MASVPGPEQGTVPVNEPTPESENKIAEEDNEESVECGFLVDRIATMPYEKAKERGEEPFCAFAPISTQDLYLLRIQECADKNRHMLVPASKEEVFNTPGALKTMEDDQEPGNEESMNYRVAIVAIARQIYSEEDKQLVVSVDPLLKKDKKRIKMVKFLTLDKFAEFAFLGFDGNVSEFVNSNNNENSANKENSGTASSQQNQNGSQQASGKENNVLSTPAVPITIKSPPKAPARRGRGGRRRMGRKFPSSSSPRHGQVLPQQHPQPALSHFFPANFHQLSSVALPHDLSSDFAKAMIKMEQNENEAQLFLNQGYQIPLTQVPDQSMYTQESFVVPNDVMMQVPTPVSEVTISTTEPGAEVSVPLANHDLITIAFDQLVKVPSEVSSSVSEKSSRGGRRAGPGRKPGRKPLKDRHPNQVDTMDDNATFCRLTTNDEQPAPKRRGRPPKIRPPVQFQSMENENSNTLDSEPREDFEN